ncbi:transposase [Phyllobacterium sp. CCNWLW109]|uniref:transposase n=1 Tax=Phyllobacterium sp. CCNWLW109 TaxID=3127479 RepID=UPI003077D4DC
MLPTVEFLTPEKSNSGGSNKWTPEFKARLVSETLRPGARVVDVAQRYGVRANRLSMWRTLAKRGRLVLPAPEDGIEFAGLVISQ